MSESQSSFVSNTNPALEESLALLEQKSLIVEKYVERVSVLEGKIEELVMEIERLNWQNREKDYREEDVKRVRVEQLAVDGFLEEIFVAKEPCEQDKKGANLEEDTITNDKKRQKEGENEQECVRKLLIKIIVQPGTEQIILSNKMHLIKDTSPQTKYEPSSLHKNSPQIHQYCNQVLTQVTQMRQQLQNEDSTNKQKIQELENENKIMLMNLNKLQQLVKEAKVLRENEKLFKDIEVDNAKRQAELRQRDVGVLKQEIQDIHTRYQEQLRQKDLLIQDLNQAINSHNFNQQTLKQQLQHLTASCAQHTTDTASKSTLIQQLQLKLTQLSQELFTQQQQAAHMRNLLSVNEPTINIIHQTESTFSQTDPELILDINFLRQTREKATPSSLEEHSICLPPSLGMLGFDFDHSMSSEAQNKSNLSAHYNKRQIYSNLSSSSFSKNDRHMDEMHTTNNMVKVHEQKKSSSEQKIQKPLLAENEEKPRSNQSIKTEYQNIKGEDPTINELKELKPRAKVASYSEKNIIVQEPNQDQDHSEFKKKSKKNILHVNPYIPKPAKSQGSEQLIQSRSAIASSGSTISHNANHDFQDPINDCEMGDSDHPSQTYKNSLVLPNKHSSSAGSDNVYQLKSDQNELSKSIPFQEPDTSSPVYRQHGFNASDLLDLKSPQNIMKSLIEKSFPIEKNPFKLSNEYINVAEIIMEANSNPDEVSFVQKNKSSNQVSQSLVNILIESMQDYGIRKTDEIVQTITQNGSSLQVTPQSQQARNQSKQNSTNCPVGMEYMTPKKKETIDLAESLDFASLKLIEKDNQNSKSKKRPKVVFLRR